MPDKKMKPTRNTRLLIISRNAGGMNEQVEAKLRSAFADHLIVDFDPNQDLEKLVTVKARIVVAGGDGTVEFVVRRFAETRHPVGIIPLGTFNNLARALGLPIDIDAAIQVARDGRARPITLGRVNDRVFVEACAIGLFGETIALGESAKDMEFGKLVAKLKDIITARRFQYELSGDFEGSGAAMSLVFSNTSSIGSLMPVSDASPIHPQLDFSVHAGETRTDIATRALKSMLLNRQRRGVRPGVQVQEAAREDEAAGPCLRRQHAGRAHAGNGHRRGQRPSGPAAEEMSGRPWLVPLIAGVTILLAVDTALVATLQLLPFDLSLALWVQSAPWGPVTYLFDLTNSIAGWIQVAVGAVAVAGVFALNRRAGAVMAAGAISTLLDNLIKLAMARQRPAPDLVHIISSAPGFSYPSGHATFFTWLSFMLAFSISPHVKPAYRWPLWVAAALTAIVACVARVWAGAHWPSDVIGGFLLGLGWSAFVIWAGDHWLERRLTYAVG